MQLFHNCFGDDLIVVVPVVDDGIGGAPAEALHNDGIGNAIFRMKCLMLQIFHHLCTASAVCSYFFRIKACPLGASFQDGVVITVAKWLTLRTVPLQVDEKKIADGTALIFRGHSLGLHISVEQLAKL